MSRPQLFIFIGIGVLAILIFTVFAGILPGRKSSDPHSASLKVWGIKDDEGVWLDLINKFEEKYPHIKVEYQKIEESGYEDTLLNSLAENRGPDIFMLPHTALSRHREKIYPLPQDALGFGPRDFRSVFVDGISQDLISPDGTIWGMPVFLDTLSLFYNKDVFNSAGISEFPTTWEEVRELSQLLTRKTPSGEIIRSGLALGSFRNVMHAFEILSALILQAGDPIIDGKKGEPVLGPGARRALEFYTSFADERKKNFSWKVSLGESLDAFAEGRAAMVIGLAEDIKKVSAKNPHLNFGLLPLPQFTGSARKITYGYYFFPTVSHFSPNPLAAWEFILFASSREGAEIYLKKSRRPPARRDIIAQGSAEERLAVFYPQSLTYTGWPVPDDRTAKQIFQEAVDAVVSRAIVPEEALSRLREKLRLLSPR